MENNIELQSTGNSNGWYTEGKLNDNFKNHIRGRLLFVLSETNLKEKSKNLFKGFGSADKSGAAKDRGTKYLEALKDILDMANPDKPEVLGDYSVVFNTLTGNNDVVKDAVTFKKTRGMFGFGGKHKKNRRTRHKRKN